MDPNLDLDMDLAPSSQVHKIIEKNSSLKLGFLTGLKQIDFGRIFSRFHGQFDAGYIFTKNCLDLLYKYGTVGSRFLTKNERNLPALNTAKNLPITMI
jgi:hypothetical protein